MVSRIAADPERQARPLKASRNISDDTHKDNNDDNFIINTDCQIGISAPVKKILGPTQPIYIPVSPQQSNCFT